MSAFTQKSLRGKKVTIMGLGLLGKGLGDALFLARAGAKVTVTDLKTEEELASSVLPLRKFKNVKFVLGRHDFSDFQNVDFVLKAQGVPLDSPYISHARKNNIPIRMDDELAISFFPDDVNIVGVTGTRGKTTVATLIYHILKSSGVRAHLAGNIQGVATLDLVGKVKEGDVVVLELSSWQLQGFHDRKLSPDISVLTNFLDDHLNYYGGSKKKYFYDKSAIFKYQKKSDLLILGKEVSKLMHGAKAKKVIVYKKIIPKNWKIAIPGEHNLENIASAVLVAGALGVPIEKIKKGVESFHGVHGRLQYVKEVRGIKIYNDNSSSTPESTLTALKALSSSQSLVASRLILIMGGADKGLDMTPLVKALPKYVKHLVLLDGSGTQSLKVGSIKVPFNYADNLEDAVAFSMEYAKKGDTILFSPAFASFGMFVNVYDREKKFMKIVKGIK